jgi:hypothetical protein
LYPANESSKSIVRTSPGVGSMAPELVAKAVTGVKFFDREEQTEEAA